VLLLKTGFSSSSRLVMASQVTAAHTLNLRTSYSQSDSSWAWINASSDTQTS